MDTFDKVKRIIVEHLNVNDTYVTPDASFLYDLGTDSVDSVSLVMALESGFNVEIPDDINDKLKTIQDVVEYIDKDHSASHSE